MITLDDILNVTCEVTGVDKENIISRRRIDEVHQTARVVFCRVAAGKYTYDAIGRKINRRKQQVNHNIVNAGSGWFCDNAIREVRAKLKL